MPQSSGDFMLARNRLCAQIYRQDRPWLMGRLYQHLRNREDAEDIAGETFVQLIQSPSIAGIREPRAMLGTIAKRLIWKLWRRRELERAWLESQLIHADQHAPSAQEQVEILQALHQMDRILQDLPVNARAAFLYRHVDGLQHADIAQQLGVTERTVRNYLAQALRRCYLET